MKRQYAKPVIEKIDFDYRLQIITGSTSDCFESVMNVRVDGSSGIGHSTECVDGTPMVIGWTDPQTYVPGEEP